MEPFVGADAENPGDPDAVHGPEVRPGRYYYCPPRHRHPFCVLALVS